MSISKKSPVRVRWLFLVMLVAGGLIALMRPHSQPVRLLHLGYADHGERGRSPVFCLTNEGTRPISFVANAAGRPTFDYKVRTRKGWEGPYPFRETGPSSISGFGTSGSQANVLNPSESLTFEFARPLGPRGWKMGIAYRSCTVSTTAPAPMAFTAPAPMAFTALAPMAWTAASTNAQGITFFRPVASTNAPAIAFVPSQATWVIREPSFVTKISDSLPSGVPGWLKRAIKSLDRDSVVWGPEMK